MDTKRAVVIVGLIILAIAAWALAGRLSATPVDPVVAEQFHWKIIDKGFDPVATTTPISEIVLNVAGVDVTIGTYQGACNLIDNDKIKLLPGEVSGVTCILRGKGQEVGIFSEADKLSLKQGTIEKDENGIKSRGGFVILKKL